MSLKEIVRAWNRFFFEPVSPLPLAVFRIAYGVVLLFLCLYFVPDVLDFFGPGAIISLETARAWYGARFTVFSVIGTSEFAAAFVLGVLFIAAVGLILGFYTRLCAALAFILLVSMLHRDPAIFNGAEAVMKMMAFYLAFSHAGAALSLDRWFRRSRGLEGPEIPLKAPWAQRLIQLQFAVVYLVTCACKFRGSHWIDGTALYYVSRLSEYWRYPVPYVFEHLWTLKAMTWGTLGVEFALGAFIWIKELRYPILIGGVLLHLGIEYSMVVPFFSWVMIAGYVTFVEPTHVARALDVSLRPMRRVAARARAARVRVG